MHVLAKLSELMKDFLPNKQSLLKSLVQKPSEVVSEEASQLMLSTITLEKANNPQLQLPSPH